MEALVRGEPSRDGARQAADLLMWSGLAAVLLGGLLGLVTRRALVVVLSVMSMVGYVVVRWSLARRDAGPTPVVAAVAAATVTFTMWILGGAVAGSGIAAVQLVALPAIGILLTVSAGMVVAQSLVERHPNLVGDVDDGRTVNLLLQVSAGLLVLAPFVLIHLGASGLASIVAATGFVAVYGSAAGQLAGAGRVPHHIVAGGSVAMVAGAWYVFQFANLADPVASLAGQGLALAAMTLAAFPVALGIVALQVVHEAGDVEVEDDRPAPGSE